ncbi:MAG TPA: putative 2OG-Fe(II) oxygenase [Gammaproteobacteria bacterium]
MARKDAAFRAEAVNRAFDSAASAHHGGDRATAKRLYRKVLKLQPNHYRALRLSALLAHESHDFDEAERFLNSAVRHAPAEDSGALEDLGLLYLQTGRQEKAETVLRRAVEIQPRSLAALSRLGSTLLTCGRGSEAADVFERAREIETNDPQITYGLAHALLESKRFEDAISASDRALEINSDDAQTLAVKGVALRELGRLEEAELVLDQSVAIDSEDMNALLHLGRVRLLREDAAGAIEAFARAAALAPELATIHSQLANAHAAVGAPEKAIAICNEFLEHNPTSAALLLVKALALRDAGRAAEADALLRQDALIRGRQIKPPARYGTIERFNEALESMIRGHPSLARTHTNRATRHGIQTGSLSIEPPPEMKTFLSLIDGEIRAVLAELRAEGHGDHPWVRFAPNRWDTNSWAIVLNDQGHQLSHIHPEAWMSAVYYVAVPEDGIGPTHGEDGWIEFGRLSDQLFAKEDQPLRSIQPEPGLLVMFPSFTFHRTKPFTSAGQRISIAFDVFARP